MTVSAFGKTLDTGLPNPEVKDWRQQFANLAGGGRHTLSAYEAIHQQLESVKEKTELQKLMVQAQAMQALTTLPSWETTKNLLQGYDQLPYSKQNALYNDWQQKTIDAHKAADPKFDESKFTDQLSTTQPGPVKPTRGFVGGALDLAAGAGKGIVGLGQTAVSLAGHLAPDTLGPTSGVATGLGAAQTWLGGADSPAELDAAKQKAYDQAQIAADPNMSAAGKFWAHAKTAVTDASLGDVGQFAGTILPIAKGLKLVGAGADALLGADAADTAAVQAGVATEAQKAAVAAAATNVGRVVQTTGALTNVGLTAGTASQQAYEQTMAAPLSELQQNPHWQAVLDENGGDPDKARQALAQEASGQAAEVGAGLGGGISAVTPFLPGGGLPGAFGAAVQKGMLPADFEAAQAAERGLGSYAADVGSQATIGASAPLASNIATGRPLLEGVPEAGAVNALGGAVLGLGTHFTKPNTSVPPHGSVPIDARITPKEDGTYEVAGQSHPDLTTARQAAMAAQAAEGAAAEAQRQAAFKGSVKFGPDEAPAFVSKQPDGTWGYTPGNTATHPEADAFIQKMNQPASPEAAPAPEEPHPNGTTPEPAVLTPEQKTATTDFLNQANDLSQNTAHPDFQTVLDRYQKAVGASGLPAELQDHLLRAAQGGDRSEALQGIQDHLDRTAPAGGGGQPAAKTVAIDNANTYNAALPEDVKTRLESALKPAMDLFQQGDHVGALDQAQKVMHSLPDTDRQALTKASDAVQGNGTVDLTTSPIGFFNHVYGMGKNLKGSDQRVPWAQVARARGTTALDVLRAIHGSNAGGLANRHGSTWVQRLFARTGIPYPHVNYEERGPPGVGAYYTGGQTHTVTFNRTTQPQHMLHELVHGLTMNGIERMIQKAAQGDQHAKGLFAVMLHLHGKLVDAAGGRRLYGFDAPGGMHSRMGPLTGGNYSVYHEMMAEMTRPEFLALAAKTEVGTLPPELQAVVGRMRPRATILEALSKLVKNILGFLPGAKVSKENVLGLMTHVAAEFTHMTRDEFNRPVENPQAVKDFANRARALKTGGSAADREAFAKEVNEAGLSHNTTTALIDHAFNTTTDEQLVKSLGPHVEAPLPPTTTAPPAPKIDPAEAQNFAKQAADLNARSKAKEAGGEDADLEKDIEAFRQAVNAKKWPDDITQGLIDHANGAIEHDELQGMLPKVPDPNAPIDPKELEGLTNAAKNLNARSKGTVDQALLDDLKKFTEDVGKTTLPENLKQALLDHAHGTGDADAIDKATPGAVDLGAKLPDELAKTGATTGGKGSRKISFARDVDRALWQVREGSPVKRRGDYLHWLQSLGLSDEEIARRAEVVKNAVTEAAKAKGPLSIEPIDHGTAPKGEEPIASQTVFQKVWHGSPHKGIEKFSTEKIGSGEGAQSYGHGLYFAGKKEVADYYREKLARNDSGDSRVSMMEAMFKNRKAAGLSDDEARQQTVDWASKNPQIKAEAAQRFGPEIGKKQGQLYEVDIPEDHQLLDFDKPLNKQSPDVQQKIKALLDKINPETMDDYLDRMNADVDELTGREVLQILERAATDDVLPIDHPDIFNRSVSPAEQASHALNESGIPGMRYLDGGSRTRSVEQLKSQITKYKARLAEETNASLKPALQDELTALQKELNKANNASHNYVIFHDEHISEPTPLFTRTSLDDAVTPEVPTVTHDAGRENTPAQIAALRSGKPAPAATPTRAVMQAAGRKDWGAVRSKLAQIGDYLNEHLHDFRIPFIRYLHAWPIPDALKQAIHGALDLAPGRRTAALLEGVNHGGRERNRLLADLMKSSKDSAETVRQYAGMWLTARHAPTGNERFLKAHRAEIAKAQPFVNTARDDVNKAQAAHNAAPTSDTLKALQGAKTRLANATRILGEAQKAHDERKAAINNPDVNATFHKGGGVAGYTNAQAAEIRALVEKRYGKAKLDEIAKHNDRMNAWSLAKRIESGLTRPEDAVRFLDKPEHLALLQQLREAGKAVDAKTPGSQAKLDAARDKVIEAIKSDYVPLTGDPTKALDQGAFGGARQPNTARDYVRQGRTSSAPDNGISATDAAMYRTASKIGWKDFQDGIAHAYDHMTPEQRQEAGIFGGETLARGQEGIAVRRPEGDRAFSFRDPKMMQTLHAANVETAQAALVAFGQMTKLYSFAATQLNLFFAPHYFLRDFFERSENLRQRVYLDANGKKLDSTAIAQAMLSHIKNPRLLAATGRYAFGMKPAAWREDAHLREFIDLGGASLFGQRLGVTHADSIKNILDERNGARQLLKIKHKTIDGWNQAFDRGPSLAAYMAFRDAGMTPKDAASSALDLMNYRKRGASMGPISAAYAFAQPAIISGANLIRSLYNPVTHRLNGRAWVRLAGLTASMMALQAFLRSLAEDDEGGNRLDQQSDLVRASYMLVPMGDSLVKIPIGYGLPRLANGAAMAILGMTNNVMTPGQATGRFVKNSLMPTISPIAANDIDLQQHPVQSLMVTAMPTWLQPPFSVAMNMDNYGSQIVKDAYGKDTEFRSEQYGKHIAPEYKTVAQEIRQVTGIDMAPEEVKVLMSYPMGPGTLLKEGMIDDPYTESQGRTPKGMLSGLATPYSQSAKFFQFEDALKATDTLLARENIGEKIDDPDERKQLAWRKEWDAQDKAHREAVAKITRDKTLSQAGKDARKAALAKQQDKAEDAALYQYRTALGQPATRTAP